MRPEMTEVQQFTFVVDFDKRWVYTTQGLHHSSGNITQSGKKAQCDSR